MTTFSNETNCSFSCNLTSILSRGVSTSFTCYQLNDYCNRLSEWTKEERTITLGVYYSQVFAGAFGFASYVLMLMTFRLPAFRGASYLYHKSMVIMEFLHMAVMFQAGILSPINFSETSAYVVYRDLLLYLWVFGDATKLSVTTVTTFVSMERCVALWSPMLFGRMNKPRVAWSFIAISTLIGLLHLSPAFCGEPVPVLDTPGKYTMQLNAYGRSGANEIVSALIYAIKIGTCVAIFVFCVFVAVGLIVKSRKAANLTSTGKDKWSSTKRLCILQMVVAISTLIDHIAWVVNKAIKDRGPNVIVGLEAIVHKSYAEAVADIEFKSLYTRTWMIQSVTGELDHCGRFLLYLICMQKFREAFGSLIGSGGHVSPLFTVSGANTSRAIKPPPATGGRIENME